MSEIIPTLALLRVCFLFLFEFSFEGLEAVDAAWLEGQSACDLRALRGLRKRVQQQ